MIDTRVQYLYLLCLLGDYIFDNPTVSKEMDELLCHLDSTNPSAYKTADEIREIDLKIVCAMLKDRKR
jgi:hypothetical protein